MSSFKVIISDSLDLIAKTILEDTCQVQDLAGISADDLLISIQDADALIIRGRTIVNRNLLQAAPKLKVVARAGVGVDNIDLDAARQLGITVINSPTATSNAVAEHTIALLLALLRKLPQADSSMKQGIWEKKAFMGKELAGKTLGIIGMGRIGARVAEIAQVFHATVIGYDPYLDPPTITQRFASPVTLDELFTRADLISLHLPLTESTVNLLDEQAFTTMKDGVCLVCTARGGIINEEALLNNLRNGKVAGAALDVFNSEPSENFDLINNPNLIATPHIGAQTHEAQTRAAQDIAEELLNALNKKPLRWQIP